VHKVFVRDNRWWNSFTFPRAASTASHTPKNSILLSVSWKATFTTVDFTNTSSTMRAHTMLMLNRGLIALGAFQTLELLLEAKEALFPCISVPITIGERRRALPAYPEDNSPTPEWSEKLDDLDKHYWADSEGIALRLEAFARNHGLISTAG
jgi:hypothetical protein